MADTEVRLILSSRSVFLWSSTKVAKEQAIRVYSHSRRQSRKVPLCDPSKGYRSLTQYNKTPPSLALKTPFSLSLRDEARFRMTPPKRNVLAKLAAQSLNARLDHLGSNLHFFMLF